MTFRSPIPALQSRPPRLNLVRTAAAANDEIPGRWELGFSYLPENCSDATVTDPCNVAAFVFSANQAEVEGEPFLVRAGERCSSFGFEAHDYGGRAQRLLDRCESKQIASEFWTGTQAQASGWPNAYLAHTDSDVVARAATVTAGLACLEQALAECGCGARGMIHATRQLVTHWHANQLVRREGDLLLTIHDTIVVTDSGYDGSGPDGLAASDGNVWAYATGIVRVLRGEPEVIPGTFEEARAQALARDDNTFDFIAQRLAAVEWDGCCHVAAQFDIDVCDIGGVS